jgi:RNA polymerase sigma factor CnrH
VDGGTPITCGRLPRRGGTVTPNVVARSTVRPGGLTREHAERLTDGELVMLALNGVEPAFTRLVERHTPHLLRIVAYRMRGRDDVLDVIQDTYLAVWRALRRYDAGRPFEAWLTAIAVNKCADWSRHRVAALGLSARLEARLGGETCAMSERSAESVAIAQESAANLIRALEQLPAHLREPLRLTAVLELRQSQAAHELGVTRKAVEMRLRRARQQLERAVPA